MANSGRPPKPTALKILEGNRGRRELNPNEPKPGSDQVACPTWLDPFAKREWRRLSRQLLAMGLLTNFDTGKMAGYCQAIADVRRLTVFLRENGETVVDSFGNVHARPQRRMLDVAWTRVHTFGSEFGFSPASRSRITLPGKREDTLDAILG